LCIEKISVCIIGLGRIASLLEDDPLREKPCTHAVSFSANPDCFIASGTDTNNERRNNFAARYNVPVYSDALEMLQKHECKILCIATHPDSHLKYCRLAADFEIPVTVCEKPLADSLRNAKKIAALSEKTYIIANHERRYAKDYTEAKNILQSGALGDILSVRGLLYMGSASRIIDVLWHDGTHLLDAIMFLTDSTAVHKKHFGAGLKEKAGTAYLAGFLKSKSQHGKKIPFVIETGGGRDHLVFEIEVSLSRGRLRIGNGVFEVWNSACCTYACGFRSLTKTTGSFDEPTGYFANMAASAVQCVRDRTAQSASTAADALAVIKYLSSL
jgi:predicted dehydrogenase